MSENLKMQQVRSLVRKLKDLRPALTKTDSAEASICLKIIEELQVWRKSETPGQLEVIREKIQELIAILVQSRELRPWAEAEELSSCWKRMLKGKAYRTPRMTEENFELSWEIKNEDLDYPWG
jgi:hypothetical protein